MRIIGNAGNSARKVQAVASGALASGDTVIVNSDGTVSVVDTVITNNASSGIPVAFRADSVFGNNTAITFDSNSNKVVVVYSGLSSYPYARVGTVSGTSISFGSEVEISSSIGERFGATFDSNSNKVVITYSDAGDSSKGKAIVGTVSGTSISFGSPVVFESGAVSETICTFDSNSNKIVVSYTDFSAGYYGTAIVGTVSGTSISFGSAVVYESAEVNALGAAFDSNSNKVVLTYNDDPASDGTAIVGTVSGTSISFGSPVVFSTSTSRGNKVVFDSSTNKVVIAYRDRGNLEKGTAVVGTVSGTSISFGSQVIFEEGGVEFTNITFDSSTNRFVIGYSDRGNSDYGTAITGEVIGNSVNFGTKTIFQSSKTEQTALTFDSNLNKAVVSYRDGGNLNHGKAAVITPTSFGTNLTSENFIGIASNGYATGQAATINAKGFIDDNQTGLTPGQSYYVQTDGTLGTTAGDPSVFAGTAVSANKLIVKG